MKRIFLSILISVVALTSVRADLIWYEGFNYTNGYIVTASTNLWLRNSGSGNDMFVNDKRVEISATGGTLSRQDDCNRRYALTAGSPYTNTIKQYASFTVICTNLPNGAGSYFATFYSTGNGFFGRIQALTSGTAVPNTWRLGISGNTSATATGVLPVDLATNVPYQVVAEWDPVDLFVGTVWVNPISSTDPSAISTDSAFPAPSTPVNAFCFRQAGTFGNSFFFITNLAVATTFGEAATNDWSTKAVAPIIAYSPESRTNFSGQPFSLSGVAAGQGLRNLTYTWLKNGAPYSNPDGNTNILSFLSPVPADSGNYQLVAQTPFGLSATSAVANVWVTNAPVPPTITSQPASNTTVYFGQSATLQVAATGPGTITYTWYYNGGALGPNVSGDGTPTILITDVQTNNGTTGTYRCAVSNEFGGLLSSNAVLTATPVPTVSIAFLRTLVDPVTYLATNSTQLWRAVGTVTTYTNLTTFNTSSYYLQDSTAGINIFATFGSTFRPQQGDVLAFVGVLSSFNSTLELLADTQGNPLTSYTVLSNDISTLPAPQIIQFGITNNLSQVEALEGSLVMITNVFFGASAGTLISTTANTTVVVTNAAGESLNVFFSSQDLDTAGQTLPSSAVTIVGPLTQNLANGANPRNQGYSVTVTRFSDIVTNPLALAITHSASSSSLAWPAAPVTYPYTVWSAADVTGPYAALTNRLRFLDQNGSYNDPNAGGIQKYYRLSTP